MCWCCVAVRACVVMWLSFVVDLARLLLVCVGLVVVCVLFGLVLCLIWCCVSCWCCVWCACSFCVLLPCVYALTRLLLRCVGLVVVCLCLFVCVVFVCVLVLCLIWCCVCDGVVFVLVPFCCGCLWCVLLSFDVALDRLLMCGLVW